MSSRQRQLHFNAFLMSSGHHEAAWRLPESNPFANTDLGHWRELARIAERARFDSLFLADGPAVRADPQFRETTTRYMQEFERLLTKIGQNDRDGSQWRAYLLSNTGKVYTILAHASGKLG